MISAGAMDRRITLQRKTETVSDAGTVTETWADLATIWAQLLPPAPIVAAAAPTTFGTTERDEAFGFEDMAILVFRVRWQDFDLTGDDRVTYAGDAYQVIGATEIGRRVGLDIRVKRLS
jgi:head-tail adaptor